MRSERGLEEDCNVLFKVVKKRIYTIDQFTNFNLRGSLRIGVLLWDWQRSLEKKNLDKENFEFLFCNFKINC